MRNPFYLFLIIGLISIVACDKDGGDNNPVVPTIVISNHTNFEGNEGTSSFSFPIILSEAATADVSFDFETRSGTADEGDDFVAKSGTITIPIGQTQASISIEVVIDDLEEQDESFEVVISNAVNATILSNTAIGTIRNDDTNIVINDIGYSTPTSYPGMTMVWSDEFDGSELNPNDWTYETGGGGWGNNELQNYKSGDSNSSVTQGKLIIEAQRDGGSYSSARIKTQNKQFFQYGRIDIRAQLPQGQGVWPALWMLGESFETVGWPACGEIDIMELVGHEPEWVYGTVHWENQGEHAEFGGSTNLDSGIFADEFHVFSIIWNQNQIRWLMDDEQYHVIDINGGELSEFREEFFFIFNIAVGGNWPGSPDATTVFPQRMFVDYVRVFQF